MVLILKHIRTMETEIKSIEKPIVVEGNYYWVKSFKTDKEFEPAKM
jgi:hypothetical protein